MTTSTEKKKVLYITFARLPSTAAHTVNIMKMCQAISRQGYDVVLMADFRGEADEIFKYYGIMEKFNFVVNWVGPIKVFGRLIALLTAFVRGLRIHPDKIFVRDVFNGILVLVLGRCVKGEIVYEAHEFPLKGIRRLLLKKILKSNSVGTLVFISKRLKKLAIKKFGDICQNKKCVIAHDGVDLEAFDNGGETTSVRRYLGVPDKIFIAGYTGSVFKGRGVEEIILRIAPNLQDVVFVIVGGEGHFLENLKKRVNELRLNNVKLVGSKPHEKIPAYLKSFDILLMPYQEKVLHRQKNHDTSQYMSPLKMFEYMASGKPIIASRLPVIEEVLEDGRNALLVTPGNVKEWINAVLRIKNDKKLAKRIGEQAKRDVVKYSWDKRAAMIFGGNDEV